MLTILFAPLQSSFGIKAKGKNKDYVQNAEYKVYNRTSTVR